VFALGGPGDRDDPAETGYWASRLALERLAAEAASQIAEKGLAGRTIPALVGLVSKIVPRFAAIVEEQLAAKAAPIAGSVTGATINYLFMSHFQEVARGHFVIRRLEATYGQADVEATYRDAEA
jgi:hypothetical protein